MRLSYLFVTVLAAVGTASCAHDSRGGSAAKTAPVAPYVQPQPSPAPARLAAAPASDGPVAPEGAQWTIFCDTIRGFGHVDKAAQLKARLMKVAGLHDWHLIHHDDETTLYYGFYRTIDDPKDPDSARARADRRAVGSLTDDKFGDPLFHDIIFVPISAPDPDSPPQWDLARTPATMYWSLQIAAYRGSPERKKYAVEAVREARAAGIEAYYYHGDSVSSVCIGAWPESAIKSQDNAVAHAIDPEQPILVTSEPIPENVNVTLKDNPSGKKPLVESPKLDILDPTLRAAIKQFPDHAINGEVHYKNTPLGRISDCSFLVVIPHTSTSAIAGNDTSAYEERTHPAPAPAQAEAPPAAAPGEGRLRSIGGN